MSSFANGVSTLEGVLVLDNGALLSLVVPLGGFLNTPLCTHQYTGPLFYIEFTAIYCERMIMLCPAASRRPLNVLKRQSCMNHEQVNDQPSAWRSMRSGDLSREYGSLHVPEQYSDTLGPRNPDSLSMCTIVYILRQCVHKCTCAYVCA